MIKVVFNERGINNFDGFPAPNTEWNLPINESELSDFTKDGIKFEFDTSVANNGWYAIVGERVCRVYVYTPLGRSENFIL